MSDKFSINELKDKKLLVVEENESYLKVVQAYLLSIGAKVWTLNDWNKFGTMIEQNSFDKILCDYNIENTNILKCLSIIKNNIGNPNDVFIRLSQIEVDLREFIKNKKKALEDSKKEKKDSDFKKRTLELKQIFAKKNKITNDITDENSVINARYFLDETLRGYVFINSKKIVMQMDIIGIEKDKIIYSLEGKIDESDISKIQFKFRDKDKLNEVELKGNNKKIEDGIFGDVIYEFLPSGNDEKVWAQFCEERESKQGKISQLLNVFKN